MAFKFEKLEVWSLALDYVDRIYGIAHQLPHTEEYNLKSQIIRAATSVALNVAEGSTGQTNEEQARFIGLAIRSLLETVACQKIIQRRSFLKDNSLLDVALSDTETLAIKLQAFRKAVAPNQKWLREETEDYKID